jgi:hypothetical protein
MMFWNHYQTGAIATLVVFAICLLFALMGALDIAHHHRDGWLQISMGALFAFNFYKRFSKDSKIP